MPHLIMRDLISISNYHATAGAHFGLDSPAAGNLGTPPPVEPATIGVPFSTE